jgi:hypothetical protein
MAIAYRPLWLTIPAELQAIFAEYGIAWDEAQAWLAKASHDRVVVFKREADPENDLFRVPDIIRWTTAGEHQWSINPRSLNWSFLSVLAHNGKPYRVEVSSGLLRRLLSDRVVVKTDDRDAVIGRLLREGKIPPKHIPWKEFCSLVRDQGNGWTDKKASVPAMGFSDRQIKRVVNDKMDIAVS